MREGCKGCLPVARADRYPAHCTCDQCSVSLSWSRLGRVSAAGGVRGRHIVTSDACHTELHRQGMNRYHSGLPEQAAGRHPWLRALHSCHCGPVSQRSVHPLHDTLTNTMIGSLQGQAVTNHVPIAQCCDCHDQSPLPPLGLTIKGLCKKFPQNNVPCQCN